MADPKPLPVPFHSDGVAGFLDRVEGAPLPLVRLFGWYARLHLPELAILTGAGRMVHALTVARCRRTDVVEAGLTADPYSGFRAEFLLEDGEQPAEFLVDGVPVHRFSSDNAYSTVHPHYFSLFRETRVLGRDSIYGSGPPCDVAEEFKQFAAMASGRILDFGAGNGDLLVFLRGLGRDARGIELDEPRIRNALKDAALEYMDFYAGGGPLPYPAGAFDWIVSTEVIEHVADIHGYVAEFARVLKPGGRLLLTTPDITSIPSSFPASCVPWHLLEATHVNFFTPHSVAGLFAPCFHLDRFYCLGAGRINGLFVPGSIGAVLTVRGAGCVR